MIETIWIGKTSTALGATSSGTRFGPDPQITIPASGLWKCRKERPDRRPHSITPQKRSETTCATDGNHRRAVAGASSA